MCEAANRRWQVLVAQLMAHTANLQRDPKQTPKAWTAKDFLKSKKKARKRDRCDQRALDRWLSKFPEAKA